MCMFVTVTDGFVYLRDVHSLQCVETCLSHFFAPQNQLFTSMISPPPPLFVK